MNEIVIVDCNLMSIYYTDTYSFEKINSNVGSTETFCDRAGFDNEVDKIKHTKGYAVYVKEEKE